MTCWMTSRCLTFVSPTASAHVHALHTDVPWKRRMTLMISTAVLTTMPFPKAQLANDNPGHGLAGASLMVQLYVLHEIKETISYDLILKKNIENLLEIPKIKKKILNTTSKVIVYDKKHIIPGLVALEIISG